MKDPHQSISEEVQAGLNIEFFLNLSKLLLDSRDNELDYQKLAGEICRISGAEFSVFNLYSEDRKKFRNIAIYGKSNLVSTVYKLLGFTLINREWETSYKRLNDIKHGHLVKFDSIFDLAKGVLPEQLCNAISAAMNVGPVYVVEISVNSDIIGDFILFFRKNSEIINRQAVATFANIVGIAVNRNNIEKRRLKSESNLRNFFNAGIDFHWVLDESGIIIEINETVRKRLGYSDEELLGQTCLIVHPPEQRSEAERIIKLMIAGKEKACHIPLISKSGTLIPVETYVIRGEWNGKPALFGISKDISELKMSEDKFYKTFNTSPDIMGLSTLDTGIFVEVNKAFCDIIGYSQEEVIGKSSADVLNFDAEVRERLLAKMRKEGSVRNEEIVILTKTGKPLNLLLSAEVIKMQDKEYNLTVAVDITSRKVFEDRLLESEANLKAIIENTMENIWSVNTRYEIQYVNEKFISAFHRTFGIELKVGLNILDTLPANIREMWRNRYDRCFLNEHFIFEDRIDVGDQHIYIEVSMNPIIVDGRVVGASLYGKDVTEKMVAQLQLRYQADLRKLLVELSSRFINLPIGEIGPAISGSLEQIGEFVGADRAYVVDYDFISGTASNAYDWCRPAIEFENPSPQIIPITNFERWVELHKKGESVKINNVDEVSDTSLRNLLVFQNIKSVLTIPLLIESECVGFVGFGSVVNFHNFTDYEHQLLQVYAQMLVNVRERIDKERKIVEAKEKAEESDHLKSAFLANMSHEIRTPMNGILGFLELLKEPDLSEENKATYIDIVTQSGQRLLTTLNDIIEISKIDARQLKVHLTEVMTDELMAYFAVFFKPQADSKGLALKLNDHLRGKDSVIVTDKGKLESMLFNFLKNAVKFTKHGTIEFGNYVRDNYLVFYVKDTGPGIPGSRINIIFDRFVQGDMSTSRPHEGSGLGLSIVKGYAGMLDGKVWVESEAGKGSTFYFSLPYITAGGSTPEQLESPLTVARKSSGQTILVVEDDFAGYLYIENILASAEYKVVHITDGIETVKFVRDNGSAELILMDLKIPGISGLEAVRRIREFNRNIPIVAQTAYAFDTDRIEAIDAGCNDYISKPVNRNDLLRIIRKFLG